MHLTIILLIQMLIQMLAYNSFILRDEIFDFQFSIDNFKITLNGQMILFDAEDIFNFFPKLLAGGIVNIKRKYVIQITQVGDNKHNNRTHRNDV